ncbi:glycoside hydrolase family 95 protein [Nonomuraea sp. SYSU D8015]|uniref:glycoside hydrolase family 95 protein n=1 Tax=Nonomuraea sp. SYSU D8015 TaxID=2593644 RepID=UPI001660BCFA|nr:glycoside hydrolase family 95 protein [Nonomuraea sp. SYSU D8015]
MDERHRIRLAAPAAVFHDAFLLGNGSLGATVYGRAGVERVDLNLDTVWSGGPSASETSAPAGSLLPELRRAIRERDHLRADELARSLQGSGYTQSYQPLGWLEWEYAPDRQLDGYIRELDLAEAIASTAYGPVRVESFVSAPDGVLVMSVTGGDEVTLPAFVSEHPTVEVAQREAHGVRWLVATGRAPAHVLPNYVDREPAVVYAADESGGTETVPAGMGFAVVVAVHRAAPGEVRLIAAAASGFRGFDRRPSAEPRSIAAEAEQRVARALSIETSKLRARHREDYRGYFDRVDLDLSASGPETAGAELFFHLGRYLLISSSRPGTQAANLQGIWNLDVRPGWSCNYTTNINLQMNYWAAESTGLQELHEPLFRLTRELVESGAPTATRCYAARGSVVHHNTDIWRFSTPVHGDPQWANWPSGLLWLSAHLWDHLDYGADDAFAVEIALPVFRSVARFALDMLVPDERGELVMSPSTSPEHHFLVGASAYAAVSEGSAMDQELVRETLSRYVSLAQRFASEDDDAELAVRARAALANLRDVAIGSTGELLEWYDERPPREPGHRHLSHLYGLYPGTRITEAATPAHFAAARRALRHRLEHGSGYTGWSQAWILCLAARLRDAELAEQAIAVLLGELSSQSLLDLHPHDDWPGGNIFQIDGNLGAVAGMTELLVQSHEGAISLLKALPTSWPAGSVRGVRCRGGHQIDLAWRAGTLVSADITVGRPGEVVIDIPGDTPPLNVVDENGTRVPHVEVGGAIPGRLRLSWNGVAKRRYTARA